jgi:hypothetical protein
MNLHAFKSDENWQSGTRINIVLYAFLPHRMPYGHRPVLTGAPIESSQRALSNDIRGAL